MKRTYPSFLSAEEGKEVGVWLVDGPEGGRQELAAEVRTPRPASGFPPSPVDELHLTYHHVLYKNDRTAHPTGPAFRGSVNVK